MLFNTNMTIVHLIIANKEISKNVLVALKMNEDFHMTSEDLEYMALLWCFCFLFESL